METYIPTGKLSYLIRLKGTTRRYPSSGWIDTAAEAEQFAGMAEFATGERPDVAEVEDLELEN